MVLRFDTSQTPSPRESMFSELLYSRSGRQIPASVNHSYEFAFAAWLKLKNTHDLPALLIVEHSDPNGEHWHLLDSARVNNSQGIVLMSGQVDIRETSIKEFRLYLCHPSDDINIEVEELRFNGDLVRKDYIDAFKAG